MYLVKKIIDKCENSSRDWREGAVGGRTLKISQEDYEKCGKEELIQEAKKLQAAGLLTIKKWIVPDNDIESLTFRVEKLPQFYRLADVESQGSFIPKQERIYQYCKKLELEISETFQKSWIEAYYESLLERLEEGEIPRELAKLDLYLPVFRGIDNLEEPMLKRVFSKMYLKDSKLFEKELEKHVISVARRFNEAIDSDMDNKTVLEQLMIEEYSQELALKGPLKLKIWRGSEAKRVDLSDFGYGVVLNSQTLKHSVIELSQSNLRRIVTIENKANYTAMPYDPDTLYVYTHGYLSPLECEFLGKLRRTVEGSGVEFLHSGDLDYGGVKIFEYIQKRVFPSLQPLLMDVATYEKYQEYATEIKPETLKKLEQVQIPVLADVIQKMLETGKGIEQESFLTM